MHMNTTKEKHGKPKLDRSTIRSILFVFWKHARRYPLAAIITFSAIVLINTVQITIPWYLKKFFDAAVVASPQSPEVGKTLLGILAIIALLSAARWLFHRIAGFANVYFEANVMRDLQETGFDNLLGHSYRFFANTFTGSLVRKVNRLSRAFEEITDQVVANLLPLAITIIGTLIVLFNRNTLLGAILLGWVVCFLAAYYGIAVWKIRYDRARAEKDSEATGALSDALTNAVTIKLFSNFDHEKTLYRTIMDELKRLRTLCWGIGEAADAIQGALMVGIELFLLWAWIRLWQAGDVTIGDLVLLQSYLLVLFQRLWDFGRVIRRIYEGFADAAEMVEILNTPYGVKDRPAAKELHIGEGKIEFADVTFGFHQTRNILKNFTLAIAPGEKVALVGSSGAGKTTITALMLRFHDVDGGKILIDGQNIAEVTQKSLRKAVALVPQDPILFHRTIKENIRYGRLGAADGEVIEAAKKAHCHEFISRLPYGYDTYVGERGVKLSGGERQRVAIARAILAASPILILDEATSSLDSEIESLIQDALKNLMAKKTSIVIAHRLSTIVQMDKIIVIDEGKIAEMGTHDELIKRDGIYKRLWSLQAERFVSRI
ncbi:MAG: ABC transporter-related protein [Candidatus Adlerbacteria bacterium GW2011_GWC1_50_9]|uniref:ABC transporter-related protein n=2 Tax=Parcubacteria group TaxID=1794811 RepID=A0A0G1WNT1_9BACT|nr:MAG: ABC transporter-related protein [Candidatus Adlerbacteria bacterium GW2011_GWC1_50_9]